MDYSAGSNLKESPIRSPTLSEKQFFQNNAGNQQQQYQQQQKHQFPGMPSSKRDLIDNMFTYINRDLLISKIFYFFFFAAFGSLFPLMAVYFRQLGMNPTQGGILIGFRPFVEFCSAPLWGVFADKWKKGKQLLLFSLFCWIAFTLSLAFVRPPAHSCISTNSTHLFLSEPYERRRREVASAENWINPENLLIDDSALSLTESHSNSLKNFMNGLYHQDLGTSDSGGPYYIKRNDVTGRYRDPADLFSTKEYLSHFISKRKRPKHEGYEIDHSKIANKNKEQVAGLVSPRFSTIVYREDQVQQVFFVLLVLIVVGEFFSAPAITLADSVTLAYLGDDVENYGRQRMFGSLGWGVAMFLVGMALDHSTTFPNHPCGTQEQGEKNYVVCFAVFSVLMSCAFITATQFNFAFQQGIMDIPLKQIASQIKEKIKETVTGRRKIDRMRLVEEDDFDYYTKDKAHIEPTFQEKPPSDKLHISLGEQNDMVSDTVKGQSSGSGKTFEEETYFGKWITVLKMLANLRYMSVLFVAWFMGFGIGLIFTFLFWHLQDLGGSPTLFGVASVFNHISELLAYFLSVKFISKFGHVKVLYAGLLGNIIRFLYISLLSSPWWVLPFEFIQGLTHAAVWAACCSYITQAIPTNLRSSAQGILQGLHHGLGRGCGAVFGGILVNYIGSEVTFRAYGITCIFVLVGFFLINRFFVGAEIVLPQTTEAHRILEEASHLAPHGVPANPIARDLSSHMIKDMDLAEQKSHQSNGTTQSGFYGATENPQFLTPRPKSPGMYEQDSGVSSGNPFLRGGNQRYQPDPVSRESYGGYRSGNPFNDSYQHGSSGQRLVMDAPPRANTGMYQQQPDNWMDQSYGP
ncbi:major facilitator superfamily domain-containing protein 6 [Octopus bimaculoides]|uniref:Major facilitator superfamily associated domain-containing protein n=1 Tax=Octopus bimaculoides TaxID=37653 RepID=A0A0L8HMM0_OCTBM|nr:major facilitator superfamily domain-containing protein 6 [Octopus bimaculoides]|eukprot:XP_014771110.1 PREDICTED: major facilitator superfamily domain-containing protein 6-like [Octopus bimaculoides]